MSHAGLPPVSLVFALIPDFNDGLPTLICLFGEYLPLSFGGEYHEALGRAGRSDGPN